jgi:hypothetical protein
MVLLVYKTSISTSYYPIKVDLKPSSVYFQEPLSLVLLSTDLKGPLIPLESP